MLTERSPSAPADSRPGALWLGTLIGAALSIAAIVVVLSGFGGQSREVPTGPAGVRQVEITSREHVDTAVDYKLRPPVGGNHAPIWANCGIYATPVPPELAVHSMEHGAVWVTYQPDLPAGDVARLRQLVSGLYVGKERFILLSPYEGQASPVVTSAWGRQLGVDDVSDPRLAQFIQAFAGGRQSPEPQYPCTGGAGEPEG